MNANQKGGIEVRRDADLECPRVEWDLGVDIDRRAGKDAINIIHATAH